MKVFVSYRYRPAAASALQLIAELRAELQRLDLGPHQIRCDLTIREERVTPTQPVKQLAVHLREADLVLAVVDEGWARAIEQRQSEWVRWELLWARGYRHAGPDQQLVRYADEAVPVMLVGLSDGARPKREQLPEELEELALQRWFVYDRPGQPGSVSALAGAIRDHAWAQFTERRRQRAMEIRDALREHRDLRGDAELLASVGRLCESDHLPPRYWSIQRLDERTYSSIHLAWDERSEKLVVVKSLKRAHVSSEVLRLFREEVATLKLAGERMLAGQLGASTGVVPLETGIEPADRMELTDLEILHDTSGPPLLYAMPWYRSGTLADVIEHQSGHGRLGSNSPYLSRDNIRAIALQLCRTLKILHEGHPPLYHRDIKPENVLLQWRKEAQIFLADFDARPTSAGATAGPLTRAGTPEYWPPVERGAEPDPVDADLYAAAVMIAELLVARRRQPGESAGALLGGLVCMPSLRETLERALSHEASERYSSAKEFERELLDADFSHSDGVDGKLPLCLSELLPVAAGALALNVLGYAFHSGLQGPLFLDTVGTAMAAILLGPAWGAAVGVLSNTVVAVAQHNDPVTDTFPWIPVQLFAAVIWGTLAGPRSDGLWLSKRAIHGMVGSAILIGAFTTLATYLLDDAGHEIHRGLPTELYKELVLRTNPDLPFAWVGEIALTMALQAADKLVVIAAAVGLIVIRVRMGDQYLVGYERPGRSISSVLAGMAGITSTVLLLFFYALSSKEAEGGRWSSTGSTAIWALAALSAGLAGVGLVIGLEHQRGRRREIVIFQDRSPSMAFLMVGGILASVIMIYRFPQVVDPEVFVEWSRWGRELWSAMPTAGTEPGRFSNFAFRVACLLLIPAAFVPWRTRQLSAPRSTRFGRAPWRQ